MGRHRVPDAVRRSSRCSAEPGPYQTLEFVTAPALQCTASQVLRAALRPGHGVSARIFAPPRLVCPAILA
jgi:hypothetical protein